MLFSFQFLIVLKMIDSAITFASSVRGTLSWLKTVSNVIITLYHLMLQSLCQQTAQSLVNTLSFS